MSSEPMHPRVFAVILLVVSLVVIGVAVLLAFLADVINQYLQFDPKIHRSMTLAPLSFAIAIMATLAFFYFIYATAGQDGQGHQDEEEDRARQPVTTFK